MNRNIDELCIDAHRKQRNPLENQHADFRFVQFVALPIDIGILLGLYVYAASQRGWTKPIFLYVYVV